MSLFQNVLVDTQTTVTSLGGAVAGAASERLGSALVAGFPRVAPGIGSVGLEFIGRAAVASVAFSAAASLMPETSQNVFFSIIFFACNPSLIANGRDFANSIVSAVAGLRHAAAPTRPPMSTGPSCPTGKCGSSMF